MKPLLLIFVLIFNISSCYWDDISIGDKILDEIQIIKREKNDSYSYRDFKKFKEELKELSKWRFSLIEESKAKEERSLIYESLEHYPMKKNNFYKMQLYSVYESEVKEAVIKLKELMRELQEINNKENASFKDFLLKESDNNQNLVNKFYKNFVIIVSYKNKHYSRELEIEGLNIMDFKEALAKASKIFVYHFPLLYDDLEFLFSETGENFFN